MVIVIAGVSIALLDIWLGALGTLLLLSACGEALLPTRFSLAEDGVQVDGLFRRFRQPWPRFTNWMETDEGFWLMGASRSGLLARKHSVWLRCPGREDQVELLLRRYLDRRKPSADESEDNVALPTRAAS